MSTHFPSLISLLAESKLITMSKFKKFTTQAPRRLPVIILADVSGSMSADGKIETLNRSIREMLDSFQDEDDVRAKIHVAVITFNDREATLHQPLLIADEMIWEDMTAGGRTPMGSAFSMAKVILEDKEQIASRDYRPTLVLVSDGIPTDNWYSPLQELLESPRASKAVRLAMGIGAEADNEPLQAFIANQDMEIPVFQADEANQIQKFFRFVTLSVTSRSRSASPNTIPVIDYDDIEDIDF